MIPHPSAPAKKSTPFYYLLLLIPLITVLAPRPVHAQQKITYLSGTVTDQTNGEPLPGVNVYLSGTTIGISTDSDGGYALRTVKQGTYDLVFSILGYEKRVIPVELIPSSDKFRTLVHDVALQPNTYELGALEVRAENEEWKRNYAVFEREFVGQTDNAQQTHVENPWVMDLSEADQPGYVSAISDEPLHLVNTALGYEIFVEVDRFRWARTGSSGYYRAYPRFVPMKGESNRQRRRWERKRESVYKGSRQHFFRSLYSGTLGSNLFTVVSVHDLVPLSRGQVRFELNGRKGVSRELMDVVKGFRLLREIRVEHGNLDQEGPLGYSTANLNVTSSVISPSRDDGTFFIDPLGNLLDPTSLVIQGDWAADRMADTLPLDFGSEER